MDKPKKCVTNECDKPQYLSGYCREHYKYEFIKNKHRFAKFGVDIR